MRTHRYKHGMYGTRVHKMWIKIMKDKDNVSKDWHVFVNFYRDMGEPPKNKWLVRFNKHAIYSKENCKYGTRNGYYIPAKRPIPGRYVNH